MLKRRQLIFGFLLIAAVAAAARAEKIPYAKTEIVPPMRPTIWALIARPRPVPP